MKIKFQPTGQEIEGDPNKSLLQLCTENQIEIKSICKGVPSCAECRVKIVEGEYNVVPPSKAEMSLIGTNYFIDQRRLACQVRCYGDITVDLTEQIERAEIQNKKVRGFRAPGQRGSHVESTAKQGTLVLEEAHTPKSEVKEVHQANVHGVESIESGHEHLQQTEGRAHQNQPRQQQKRGDGPRNQQRGGGQQQRSGGGQQQRGNQPRQQQAQGGQKQQGQQQQQPGQQGPREGGSGGGRGRNRNRNRNQNQKPPTES
jgi:ferredoxin